MNAGGGEDVVQAVILRNRYGLHVRPATTIAQTAKDFVCDIALIKDENEVEVEIATGVKVRVVQSTIASVLSKTEPAVKE